MEWILEKEIPQRRPSLKSYVPAIDSNLQFAINGTKSKRHLVINNLPGTPYFCPLIRRTAKLEFSQADIEKKKVNT